ncbi:MAG: PilT/PilU family type 4a pilus ATPase [Labilithrix sp.]|nr:PilT/PilU family type 4a pilus ATPase [Labilithrix sp.]MCW5816341.1 PilT/PilU family type 4a pilus ATPase [Labilithrix sp.]
MLKPKELHTGFSAATWGSEAERAAFVEEAGAQPVAEIQKLLATMLDPAALMDMRRHESRIVAFSAIVTQSATPELFSPFVRALRPADSRLRAALVALVPRVNNIQRHGELCALLGAPEPEVRRAATEALRPVVGPSAFEILQQLVADRGFGGRTEAMDVVAGKAAHHAIPLLTKAIEVGSPAEGEHAIGLLGDATIMAKDLPGARKVLAATMDGPNPSIVAAAALALAGLSDEGEFLAALEARIDATNPVLVKAIIGALRRYSGEWVFEYLLRKFREGPSAMRLHILDVVESIKHEGSLPLMLEALANRRLDVRMRAADVLSRLGTSGAVDVARVVIWLLRSHDVNVRRIAIEVAKNVGDRDGELTPKLLRFLRDEDWWVRERVMDTLVEMAGPTLARHLAAILQDPSDVVRRFAIGGFARLRDPKAIGVLVRTALDDPDWWVREQAISTIADLGDKKAIPYLLEVMKRHELERVPVLHALTKLGATEAIPAVVDLLADEDADVRLAAVGCLAALDARAAGDQVRALATDDDPRVRRAALEALARWQVQGAALEVESALSALDQLLVAMAKMGADDLILIPERAPSVKHMNAVVPLIEGELSAEQLKAMLFAHLTPLQVATLAKLSDVDFSHEVKTHQLRFRAHILTERRGFGAVFRIVKNEIPAMDKLGLPSIARTFGDFKNGLVLVGGPTGSGKSTTLAAVIDRINRSSGRHIVTVEDPIEVVHAQHKSLINQRELGTHTGSLAHAMRSTLRQDPDVILVGELRDLATISFAVSAAETGHLVFGTVHTLSAQATVDRLVNAFPAGQQPQVRSQLADTLRAVLCQQLVRTADGRGRALAVEVMVNTEAVAALLRKGKTFQIPNIVQSSRDLGMQSMDAELIRLVREGLVTKDEGWLKANDKKAFETAFAPPPAQPQPSAAPQPPASTQPLRSRLFGGS